MKKTFVLSTLLVMALALAACGSTAQAGGGASALSGASGLVSALGGKAKVDGTTVTLTDTVTPTGFVDVENAVLVVPEGITLDMTAKHARLVLKDGAALTVNGTVNANAEGIVIDGAVTINGRGRNLPEKQGAAARHLGRQKTHP
ncbi:MAG: hypothetical protein LBU85_02780 [Treponema sp.]|jgi:ABC-type Fe3+-citrate transport system substrate-binding protein|nr:hypothetical protein [Treponema sp.]